MEVQPLVSVVVPLYNAEKYIEETIQSVIDQTYKHIEIWVIDDGSKDNSSSIVLNMKEKYPEYIHYYHQQNQGVAVARNTGINLANGEYIAFLDSDDFWHPEKIEKQLQSIINNQMDACYCGFVNYFENTKEEIKQETEFSQGDIIRDVLRHRVQAQTSTWLIKKNLLTDYQVFYTPGASWGEDIEFMIKLVSISHVCCVKEYLSYYRVLESGNLSSNYRNYLIKTEKEMAVFDRISKWLKENKNVLVSKDLNELQELINTYIRPYIIIDTACIYFKMNEKIEKSTCLQIKADLARYARRIYFQNGKRSFKLIVKLIYVRMKLKGNKIKNTSNSPR